MHLPLTAFYALKAIGVFAAIAIAAASNRRHHPFPRFGPANWVTTVRAGLVAAVCAFISEPATSAVAGAAAIASIAATILDGVDGWVARRTRMASPFGARFDVEVDSLLILALAILVWLHGKAGAWVLASGLLRYAFVAAGAVWPWMARPLAPTRRARVICVIQISALIVAMLPAVVPPASAIVSACGLIALASSFLADVGRLWRQT